MSESTDTGCKLLHRCTCFGFGNRPIIDSVSVCAKRVQLCSAFKLFVECILTKTNWRCFTKHKPPKWPKNVVTLLAWWPWPLTLTLKLMKTRDRNTSSAEIWRKSFQRFSRYFIRIQSHRSTKSKTLCSSLRAVINVFRKMDQGKVGSTCFASSLSNDKNQSGDDEDTDGEQTNQRQCYI